MRNALARQESTPPSPDAHVPNAVPPRPQARELRRLLMPEGLQQNKQRFLRETEAFEKQLPREVLHLVRQLDDKEHDLLSRKKRIGNAWCLFFLVLILLAVPGLIMGSGEGVRSVFYAVFMMLCGNGGSDSLRQLSFAEKIHTVLAPDARLALFGIHVLRYAELTLIIYLYVRFFRKKAYLRKYLQFKESLNEAHGLSQILNSAENLTYTDPLTADEVQKHGFAHLDDLALNYHAALARENPPPPSI